MTKVQAKGRAGLYGQGVLCGIAAAVLPGPALLLGVLIGPAVAIALFAQPAAERGLHPAVLLAGASAIVPLHQLWLTDVGLGSALELCQPETVVISWLAAAMAWVISEVAAIVGEHVQGIANTRKRKLLEAERSAIHSEWAGLD